jgi:predicted type IV restriction endonuclease
MATENQIAELKERLKTYKRKYLRKEFNKVDESATRIMVNSFLTDVLGYKELEEIKTEFRIRGEYADYVVQLKRKKHFVVEVKSIQLDLNDKHLRQSLNYAANEGIDWILLLNGRQLELYRVNFRKPISSTLIYSIDFMDNDAYRKCPEQLWFLTKIAVARGELEGFWKRTDALQLDNLARIIYSEEIVRKVRNDLKSKTDIYFQLEDIADALYDVITKKVTFLKPKLRHKTKQ